MIFIKSISTLTSFTQLTRRFSPLLSISGVHRPPEAEQTVATGIKLANRTSSFETMSFAGGVPGNDPMQVSTAPRKPRILLAACGCVAAMKFGHLCSCFSDWADVKAVVTLTSLTFVDPTSIPQNVMLYTDEHEWTSWSKIGDSVLHIELRRWADIMVIAPLSANTLAKIAGGLCDNLLTSIVRAWDYEKPIFVAPSMNSYMWRNSFTERHIMAIDEFGINLIPPVSQRLASGESGTGAMAEPSFILSTVRMFLESRQKGSSSSSSSNTSRRT